MSRRRADDVRFRLFCFCCDVIACGDCRETCGKRRGRGRRDVYWRTVVCRSPPVVARGGTVTILSLRHVNENDFDYTSDTQPAVRGSHVARQVLNVNNSLSV